MFESSILVLTGAGASIPVGIPGMAGMVREFKRKHGKSDAARRVYEVLMRAGVADDLEEVLQFCNRLVELRETEIRQVLKDAASPRAGTKLTDFESRLDQQIGDAELLRARLIDWIGNACLSFDRNEANAIYGEVVPLLAERQVPVFTTNYDGVLEEVAATKEVAVADNFVAHARGRRFWDPTHRAFEATGLRLVKMHGSIYWHSTEDGEVIEHIMQPAPRNAEGQPVAQLLIFPTRFKDIYQRNYFPLYSAFTRTLGKASTLILVGHSLRDEYLLAAVRERLKDPSFGLVVIDIQRPAATRELSGNILHLQGSIKEYAHLLCRALADHHEDGSTFAYLSEASNAVRRSKKEKIEVASVPPSGEPGQSLEGVVIKLTTLLDAYAWNVSIDIADKPRVLLASVKSERIRGYGVTEKVVRLKLPKELETGRSHQLTFSLVSENGEVVARTNRSIRIKKV